MFKIKDLPTTFPESIKKPATNAVLLDLQSRLSALQNLFYASRKGMLWIFNHSHYEDVLSLKVHGEIDKEEIQERYKVINQIETHLQHNNKVFLKLYLHISKHELRKRENHILGFFQLRFAANYQKTKLVLSGN